MITSGKLSASGSLSLKVVRAKGPGLRWHLENRLRWSYMFGWLSAKAAVLFSKITGMPVLLGSLSLIAFRFTDEDQRNEWKRLVDCVNAAVQVGDAHTVSVLERAIAALEAKREPMRYGVVGYRVVTDAGVAFLVDALQGSVEPEIMKYHALGTDDTPGEAVGDTALQLELTTQYTPDNTRATGSLAEGATANVFRSVGTNTISDAGVAVVEHGLMSQAAVAGGTLLDRTTFAVVNLAIGDSLQSTYDFTLTSGG